MQKDALTDLNVNLFGILRERVKSSNLVISIKNNSISLKDLRKYVLELYPALDLNDINFVFAVNRVIITNEDIIVFPHDEIALIPPISGG